MFILLRRIERWLHQHIFKVGWLLTHNYQTTTILYYTIFLPGVILHELVYWLVAGMINVKAKRAIKWPDAQEVGELKLNFVQINPKASALRKAVISIAPLFVGVVSIWFIANNIFDINAVVNRMSSGELMDVAAAFSLLISAPLFWLWVYIIFTIANTMYPSIPKDLQGWRSVLLGVAAMALALLVLGLGGSVFEAMQAPLSDLIFVLQATFVLMIGVDIVMVLVLGTIEYTIERTTGNSATFRGGKMITVTREEALEEQRKQREAELKAQEKKRNPAADTGIKTIYDLTFSIPGAPGQEPITQVKVASQESLEMPAIPDEDEAPIEEKKVASMPLFGGIAAQSETAKVTEAEQDQREKISARINLPERRPLSTPKSDEEAQETSETSTESAESKRQSSLFDKLSTSSIPSVKDDGDDESEDEEKPILRFGGFTRPAPSTPSSKSDDGDEGDEKPISRFGTRPVGTPSAKSDDESTEDEEKPISRFGGFSRPAPSTPSSKSDDGDDSEDEKPISRFGTRPVGTASTKSAEDEDSEEEKPISRFGGFSRPAPSTPSSKSDDSEDEKPISRFGTRPVGTPSAKSAEDEDSEEEKPISRFGGFSRPAPSTPSSKSDDSEDEKPISRFGTRPVGTPSAKSAEDEDSEEEKPISRFGGFSRPAPSTPSSKSDDGDDSEDEKPISRFGTRPVGTPSIPSAKSDEDDESTEEDKKPVSRFGGLSRSVTKSEDDDDGEEKPAVSTSSRFGTRPTAKDEDEDEKPVSRFGGFSRPASKAEDDADEEDTSLRRSTGAKDSISSLFSRIDDEDDEDDEDTDEKPSTGNRFGNTLSGASSRFASPRPVPKPTSDEDSEDDGEEEAPRMRVSPFGSRLGATKSSDDDIVYEEDEDVDYVDDDDDYADYSDDD